MSGCVVVGGRAPGDDLGDEPVYLIADPYQGKCRLYLNPKDGDYGVETKVSFGDDLDLTGTVVGLTLKTDDFPRD